MPKPMWCSALSLVAPHAITHPEKVMDLAADFAENGWDTSCPPLIGYFVEGEIQLLSGTHRQAAAVIAGIKIPVLIWSKYTVEQAWGTDDWPRIMEGSPCLPSKT